MKLCFDHVANVEIYRWGVEDAAGLPVKYLAKLAASRMFCTRSEPLLSCYFFPNVNLKYIKDIVFSPSECSHGLLEACEHSEKTSAVDSLPQSRRGHECEGKLLYVLVEPDAH
jgi:hypothetical protein